MRFEDILVAVTALTGFIWLIDHFAFRPKRIANKGESHDVKDPVLVDYAKSFFPVLLLVLVLRSFIAEPFRIPTGSMKPTLLEGDFILVNKFDYGLKLPVLGTKLLPISAPKRGDVVVFRHDSSNKDLIKRVVGLPGDRISYRDKALYINDEKVELEDDGKTNDVDNNGIVWPVLRQKEKLGDHKIHDIFLRLGYPNITYPFQEVEVPEKQYFVLGDNRDGSQDSRYWGFVDESKIIGRAFATWMSWDFQYKDVRWRRIGKFIK